MAEDNLFKLYFSNSNPDGKFERFDLEKRVPLLCC